jgi:hypothetical protein
MTGELYSVLSLLLGTVLLIHHRYNKVSCLRVSFNMSAGVNPGGVGTYLAAIATVYNPGKEAIFYGGFHAKGENGEIFYPSCEIAGGTKIEPGQYVQGAIPADHLIKNKVKSLWVVDGELKKYEVSACELRNLIKKLSAEKARLVTIGVMG